MYMRYLGGGIGHRSTWHETQASRRHAQRVPRQKSSRRKARAKVVTTNGELSDQCEGLMPITTDEEPEDIDDNAPSRSALRIVDCDGGRADLDEEREASDDGCTDSDSEREDSDGRRADVDGTREDSDNDHEDLDGRRTDSDEEHEGSDDEREGSDGGGETPRAAIDMGSEADTSDSESGSDGDGGARDSDKDSGSGSDDDGDGPVDTMYAPMGFAPL